MHTSLTSTEKSLQEDVRTGWPVLEEKIQGLSTNFSRPIPAMFYQVVLMMEISESNQYVWNHIRIVNCINPQLHTR